MLRRIFAGCAMSAACAISLSGLARADAPAPSPSPSALPEIGRIVTSDRRPEPIERTSRPTFVVDRAQFTAEGARTVADALSAVPGVYTFHYGMFGSQADYGIRGALGSQTLILLDGVPLANVSAGTIDLGTVPLESISRIEVVESGSSTLYGTSASGGVINLITAPMRGVDLSFADGSYGDRDARIALGDGHFGATFERHVSTGDFAYPALAYPMQTFPAGVRSNAWGMASSARFTGAQTFGAFSLRGDLGFGSVSSGVPGRLDFPSPNAVQSVSRSDASLELARGGARSTVSLTLAGAHQALSFNDPDFGGESDTYDSRVQISLKDVIVGERATLVAGLDAARENAMLFLGPAGPPPSFAASESQVAAYVQDQFALFPGSQLTLGARAENDAPHGSVIAPSLGALFHIGALRVAGNVGESFRVPTIVDLYYPGFSNPNLVPEKARNADVTLALPGLGGGVSFGWFARDGSNFIVLDNNFVPSNVQRASIDGLMLTAATRPYNGLVADLSLTDIYRALDLGMRTRLPHAPVMQATLGLTHAFGAGNVAFGVRAKVVGSTGDASFGAAGSSALDAFTNLDAYVRFKLERNAILSLRVKNGLDQHYAPISGYPAPGRTFEVELSTR